MIFYLFKKLSWSVIYQILSFSSEEGENIIGAPYYPSWITFARSFTNSNSYLRVIMYINVKLTSL